MNEDLSKLNLVELLDLLEPIPEPPPISLWPQTIAWIWLAIALAAVATWLGRRWIVARRRNAYRRAALKQIGIAGEDPVKLAEIVRRAALAGFPRSHTAGLYGDDWLAFLDQSYDGNGFSEGPGRALATSPYAGATQTPGLAHLAAEWVRRHRTEAEAR